MEDKCAAAILSTVMRRAYRRPVAKAEVDESMAFYRKGRAEGDFDAGIAKALSAVLTNPEFLFRVESDPKKMPAGGVYRISDLELASRLSFFLWSSIPDDELLDVGHPGQTESARRAREAGAPDARRSPLVQPGDEFCGTVAAAAQYRRGRSQRQLFSGTSTTTCGKPSGRKPNSSSTACCARIAACSRSSSRTTRFSMNAWPSTTEFPTCTEAGSAA